MQYAAINKRYTAIKIQNAKKRGAKRNPPVFSQTKDLVFLFFVLYNYFRAVIETAVFTNSVRFGQFVAMRAFNKRRRRGFVVCKSLVRSALRLFILGYCHFNTSRFILSYFRNQFRRYRKSLRILHRSGSHTAY